MNAKKKDNEEWNKIDLSDDFRVYEKYDVEFPKAICHKKYFWKDSPTGPDKYLIRFDLNNEKKTVEEVIEATLDGLAFLTQDDRDKVNRWLKDRNETFSEWHNKMDIMFWKIFNSYNDFTKIPDTLFNMYAYLHYSIGRNNLILKTIKAYEQGIVFAKMSLKVKENSLNYDAVGEGYYLLKMYVQASSYFTKAIDLDEKNKTIRHDHLLNFINSGLKLGDVKLVERGLNLLKSSPIEQLLFDVDPNIVKKELLQIMIEDIQKKLNKIKNDK